MERIASFSIDHEKLLRGIYVSRKDTVGTEVITTFDIRMKEPNREPVMNTPELHTIEHLAATWLRNSDWADKIIYFGPMGCRTGNYLLLRGDYESKDIVELIIGSFQFIVDFEGIVHGTQPIECGNCLDHNLSMAQWESKKYIEEVLKKIKPENLIYPRIPEEESSE